jgi:hypothetical protein
MLQLKKQQLQLEIAAITARISRRSRRAKPNSCWIASASWLALFSDESV